MKFANVTEILTIALAGALMFASTAKAEPSQRACRSMADTVRTQLASHPNAGEDVWSHYRTGADACEKGFTALGVSHLQTALKALGG